MNYNALCMGCFEEIGEGRECPHCGFDENQRRPGLFLSFRTLLNNQYLVGKVLGTGGFGITYLAFDVTLQCKVAIKEFFPRELVVRHTGHTTVVPYSAKESEFYSYGLDRFLMEARTMARFNHPNIVSVKNYFKANDTAYIVMDYYQGRTMGDYIKEKGDRLSEKETLKIINPIMDGLQEVHQAGFLHRDIKPHNIYITDKGTSVLIDFGAARCAVGEKSRSLSVVLTPGFAPFEQYQSRGKQGAWTDIYALCGTIYYMISGKVPPAATERTDNQTIAPLEELTRKISPGLNAAVMQGLEFHADNRPQSVEELRELLGGQSAPGTSIKKEKKISYLLQCISGEHKGNWIELTNDPLIIGRSPQHAHLIIDNHDVSRSHVSVWPDEKGRGVWVQDQGSTHGTFCETYMTPARDKPVWEPITEPQLLKLGDCIRLGDDMDQFVIECEYSTETSLPVASESTESIGKEEMYSPVECASCGHSNTLLKNMVMENARCEECSELILSAKKEPAKKRKTEDRRIEAPRADGSLYGVGGWLLFFCLSLTVFLPFLSVYNIVSSYNEVESYFYQFPGLRNMVIVDMILSVGIILFSIFAGYSLWARRSKAVSIAKNYLVTLLIYSVVAAILPFFAGLPSEANGAMLKELGVGLFRSVFYFAIWFSYLNKSKRIKATYELN